MSSTSDAQIISLFHARDQKALSETQQKYGGLCHSIAKNILGSREDAEECLNDALYKLWETIPPARPKNLAAYLSVTVRNLACNRRAAAKAAKRGGGELDVALSELENVLASPEQPDSVLDTRALSDAMNRFLGGLEAETRVMFVLRYWGDLTIKEIAEKCGAGQSKVKMTLLRTRDDLKAFLEEEGLR